MKKIVVALAFALALSSVHAAAATSERPKICFEFAFWKYCI